MARLHGGQYLEQEAYELTVDDKVHISFPAVTVVVRPMNQRSRHRSHPTVNENSELYTKY